jgi:UDP-N-acetylglucosamine 4,6-dehydratase
VYSVFHTSRKLLDIREAIEIGVNRKRVLVLGGTGSIGKALVKQCLSDGAEKVFVISRDETKHFWLQRELNNARLEAFVGDIRTIDTLDRILGKIAPVDLTFHVAAMKHVVMSEENPAEAALTNAIGTQNIIDIAFRYNIPKSILISTDKAVEPINVMGATKLIAERMFLNAAKHSGGRIFSIGRFGNVANSRASVIPVLIESLLSKRELILTDPNVDRFIMRIEDAVNLMLEAIELATGGEIFVLKMLAFRLQDLIDVVTKRIAPRLGIETRNIKLKQIGLVNGEKMHEKLFAPGEAERVFDLGKTYVITDTKTFPKHEKFAKYPRARELVISSDEAPRISQEELEKIVMEYVEIRVGAPYSVSESKQAAYTRVNRSPMP